MSQVFAALDDPQQTDIVAWNVHQFARQGFIKDSRLLAVALQATRAAFTKATGDDVKSSLLDTIGHMLALEGKFEEAIAAEKQALALADRDQKEVIQRFLTELEEARAAAQEKDK